MTGEKTIQTKMNQRQQSSQARSVPAQQKLAGLPKIESFLGYVLNGLVLAYFIYYIVTLYASLGNTFFWADENFHAYITAVIFKIKSLPAVLPDIIYGGYEYSYPPFFHILSAVVMSIAGFAALKFINLVLLILFLAGFYLLIRKHYGNNEALLASLLLSLSPTLAINSIRFMTEMLSMVLIFFSFFCWVVAIKKRGSFYAIISGMSTGLLILSKQVGIVVFGFYCILLIWFWFKRRQDARLLLFVIGTAVCVMVPYVVWAAYHGIEVFGFVSMFLGAKPEWATAAVNSFRRYDSSLREFGYLFYSGNGAVITASFLIPLYHFIRTRAKDAPQNYIFLMSVYLAVVMVVWHITNPRHTITLLPFIAFLFGYALQQVITHKRVIKAIILLLCMVASYFAFQMPNYRQNFNAPEEFLELTEMIKNDDAASGKTLVVYAFDTAMYTHKPVIWPHPNLREIPLDLFENHTPASLYRLLENYRIDYILIDFKFVLNFDKFMGRNYPLAFVRICETLTQNGKLSVQALSKSKQFLLLKVS